MRRSLLALALVALCATAALATTVQHGTQAPSSTACPTGAAASCSTDTTNAANITSGLINAAQFGQTPTTWTPTDGSGAALTFTGVSAQYAVVQNSVIISLQLTYPTTASGANAVIASLPVGVPNAGYATASGHCDTSGGAITVSIRPVVSTTTAQLINDVTAAQVTNANMSTLTLKCSFVYPQS